MYICPPQHFRGLVGGRTGLQGPGGLEGGPSGRPWPTCGPLRRHWPTCDPRRQPHGRHGLVGAVGDDLVPLCVDLGLLVALCVDLGLLVTLGDDLTDLTDLTDL